MAHQPDGMPPRRSGRRVKSRGDRGSLLSSLRFYRGRHVAPGPWSEGPSGYRGRHAAPPAWQSWVAGTSRPRTHRRGRRVSWAAVAAFVGAMLLTGSLSGAFGPTGQSSATGTLARPNATTAPSPSPSPTPPPPLCEKDSLIATVAVDEVVARRRPRAGSAPIATFDRTDVVGAPQVFLVVRETFDAEGDSWFKVFLPIRPNGSTGYVPSRAVRVVSTPYRLVLQRDRFRLGLYKGCSLQQRYTVGIGTGETPTPLGDFYLASLLKLPDPNTIYGTYAYGLSGFSEKLTNWRLGGIVGLHGTNAPTSVGVQSTHGCIRMYNEDVESLVPLLPLGTPITIVRSKIPAEMFPPSR